jgi:hypothetical protein
MQPASAKKGCSMKDSESKEAAQKAASSFAIQLNLKQTLNLKLRSQTPDWTNHHYYPLPGP